MHTPRTFIGIKTRRRRRQRHAAMATTGILVLATLAGNFIHLVPLASAEAGYHWSQSATSSAQPWASITSNANGTKLWVASQQWLSESTDSGVNWVQSTSAGSRYWLSVASSADGVKLAAIAYGSNLFFTSTDSGTTWTNHPVGEGCSSATLASSSDGSKLVLTCDSDILTSGDYGVTWVKQAADQMGWTGVTSSADGTKLAAVGSTGATDTKGSLYTSNDSGVTWVKRATPADVNYLRPIVSSADGMTLASAGNTRVIISTDGGATWTDHAITSYGGYSLAMSADGTKIVSGGQSDINVSIDSGATWTTQVSAGSAPWNALYMDPTGSHIVAGGANLPISYATYSQAAPAKVSNLAVSNVSYDSLDLSWAAADNNGSPLTDYKVEYSSDGGTTWNLFQHAPSTASSIHVIQLTPSTAYIFRVSAINAIGVGATQEVATNTTAPVAPSAPLNFSAVAGDGKVALGWGAPVMDGGSPIIAYNLQYKQADASQWNVAASGIGSSENSYTVSGLTNGASYIFRIEAVTAAGASVWVDNDLNWDIQSVPFTPFQVAATNDPTHLAAISDNGLLPYMTTDKGQNWIAQPGGSSSSGWGSIASNTDGTKLIGVKWGNTPFVTSRNSGVTWTSQSVNSSDNYWEYVASSADGLTLYAVHNSDGIYKSTDGGTTWSLVARDTGPIWWAAVAVVGNGSTLYGLQQNNNSSGSLLMKSTDGGQTWSSTLYQSPWGEWDYAVSASTDGKVIVISGSGSNEYLSTDSGQTWQTITYPDALHTYIGGYASVDPSGDYLYRGGSNTLGILPVQVAVTPTGIEQPSLPSSNITVTSGTSNTEHQTGSSQAIGSPSLSSSDSIPSRTLNPADISGVTASGVAIVNGAVITTRPTFSGTAHPYDTVTVTVHSQPVTCTAQADANGFWSCTLPSDLPVGSHTVLWNIVSSVDGSTTQIGPYNVKVLAQSVTPSGQSLEQKQRLQRKSGAPLQPILLSVAVVVLIMAVVIGLRRRARTQRDV